MHKMPMKTSTPAHATPKRAYDAPSLEVYGAVINQTKSSPTIPGPTDGGPFYVSVA